MSTILVLAGVNGAGKSSLVGSIAAAEGLVWFDPDAFTRELEATGCPHDQANSKAWEEGKNRLAHPSNLDELGMTPEWGDQSSDVRCSSTRRHGSNRMSRAHRQSEKDVP